MRRGPGGGQLVGDLLAGDLQLAPVVLGAADEVELSTEQHVEQLIALGTRRAVAGQYEVHLHAEHGAGGGRHATVVGLGGPHGDE